ncbi:hypothetical protein [Ferrimicrobium sp.]|jgi:hypothetical protein|uniref:hypothetical protein n=1 Tax=Ferrimicrobium sp. TaxID=2926050 RepID=UPI00262BBA54|nr:hypothetical protein [Ferrimicrobium sp.]
MTSIMATIIGALPGTGQITTIMSSIQTFLNSFVLILGPVVFLFGLVAHGLGSTHNSQGMSQWGTRAMKAGAGIVIGAVLLNVLFSVLKGL